MTILRRFLAALSACGIALSVFIYIGSWSQATLDSTPWLVVLGMGAIAINVPIYIVEPSSRTDWSFYWKGFARGMPRWVVPFVRLFWLIALAQGVWLFLQSHGAVAVIYDGQYVLDRRGRIVQVLTESEYLALKAEELRMYAALMIAVYLLPMMYWSFPRRHEQMT